ncbi:hypothetical protein PFICI_14238 [Pestalotiopsis fici W106-1]|uniref:Zn(2)-C6 fungal-type domain-containing protein n=1 Tax=Pestalotiopsis fici (strain W106-1 / CGMCC3.15140) TaxID=1229662 RepID=W3WMJ5_PESFW|nr:uncharacterized protein PFICI_14238 [Pestalotiopsis fici W106-1]ETS74372.1 hypothetical protein PFICI_14238 [Pestalotiopsis fici W106-1]
MADATVLGGSETPQPPPRAGGARRYNVERSCIRCHQKKIRCDKSIPCSTCVKSGNVESCRYPGPERAKRRPRKEASTSLVEQVERLEQIVSNSLKRKRNHDQDERPSRVRSSSLEGNLSHRHPSHGPSNFTGLLVKDGNMVRYVNDHVLSHILEKVLNLT